jgi:2-iminobutanoate/2-iminopropanoate deaminase
MAKQVVESPHVARTKGPYVQGIEVTDAKLVFTSGVIARDAAGTIVGKGDIHAQTRQRFQTCATSSKQPADRCRISSK